MDFSELSLHKGAQNRERATSQLLSTDSLSRVCVCVSLITYIYSAAFRFRTCCLKQQNPSKVNLSKANFLYSTVVTCSRARQQMQSKDNVLTCLAEPPTRHKHMQNCYVCNFTVLHRHQVTVCWLFSSSHLISQ